MELVVPPALMADDTASGGEDGGGSAGELEPSVLLPTRGLTVS